MELRHLRYFIRAAELLNFTKAAESLYVSQPTLSVQIHQLEQELGTELFTRVGRNLRLTETGKVFLERAQKAVSELEAGSKEIDAITGLIRGKICIASLPLYGSKLVSGWISIFNARYPNVSIKVKAMPTEDIELGVIAGNIDLAFAFLPSQHSELRTCELFEDEIVLVASKKNPLTKHKSLSSNKLAEISMALPSEKVSVTRLLGQYFGDMNIQPKVSANFDDGHALLEFVKRSNFVTFLPKGTVLDDPELALLPLPAPGLKVMTGALWTYLSPAGQIFLDLMKEESRKIASQENDSSGVLS